MRKPLKDYFVPHRGNDFKPHSLQRTSVVLMSVLVLLTFTFANLQALLWVNSDWLISTILPSVIVEKTNENRETQALGSLARNSVLDAAAQQKAEHMAENGYFAHFAPDGTSPWYFFDQSGYQYMHAGENLAVHFSDSDEVVKAWMESPTHRENIMNGKYTEIGIGTAKGEFDGYPTVFVVQLFGAPMPAAAPIAEVPNPEPVALAQAESVPLQTPETIVQPVTEVPAPEPVIETAPDTVPVELVQKLPASIESSVALASEEASVIELPPVEISQVVAGIENNQVLHSDQAGSSLARLATQPHRLINIVYATTAMFVLVALMISIFVEIRRQHPVQIAYGTGLLATMALLMYVHLAVTSGALIA